jgi:hypothetical protein
VYTRKVKNDLVQIFIIWLGDLPIHDKRLRTNNALDWPATAQITVRNMASWRRHIGEKI